MDYVAYWSPAMNVTEMVVVSIVLMGMGIAMMMVTMEGMTMAKCMTKMITVFSK